MEEAEIKICEESGEKVDNKVRLDVLKKEEQMIAEENEELLQEEEEKRKKVSLADKRQVLILNFCMKSHYGKSRCISTVLFHYLSF